jgi:hypothetical protein
MAETRRSWVARLVATLETTLSRSATRTCCNILSRWNTPSVAPIAGKRFRWFSTCRFGACQRLLDKYSRNLLNFSCVLGRLVDPDLAGKSRWCGSASYEALRVTLVSNIEHILALPQDVFRLAIVNRRRRQQADAGMTVLIVVPPKKTLTESTTVLDAPKAVRELRPIF